MSHNPYVRADAEEAAFFPSRRATFSRQSRANHGTLNLFSPSYYQVDAAPQQQHQQQSGSVDSSARPSRSGSRQRYHNYESTETREFPSAGIRRVKPLKHTEGPQGIRQVRSAPGAKQSLQVVNITPAYKDPAQMDPPRPCVRVLAEKLNSGEVKDALAYKGTAYDRQLRGEVAETPVGQVKSAAPKRFIDYTRQENFCQAVRDHVQQRARGATEFYVQLCRGTIGGVTASTPKPQLRQWTLEQEPDTHTLTLARCRDQLTSLTDMPITLLELADLIWDVSDVKENTHPASDGEEQDAQLGARVIPYKDFSAAFATNSSNIRLAVKKI